jgi:alpha-tubulin suppressor-like RCC1 family protein
LKYQHLQKGEITVNKFKLSLGILTLSLMLVISGGCNDQTTPKISGFETPEEFLENPHVAKAIDESGISIILTNDPPMVDGRYHSETGIVLDSSDPDIIGSTTLPTDLCFHNQTSSGNIDFAHKSDVNTSTGEGFLITGDGDKFMIWQETEVEAVESDCHQYKVHLISGTKQENGGLESKALNIVVAATNCGDITAGDWFLSKTAWSYECECAGLEDLYEECDPNAQCGNNIKEDGEVCDGTDVDGETCESLGLGEGTLVCRDDCSGFDAGGCTSAIECGNNIKEESEVCDGTDVDGETCESLGLDEGTLVCRTDCSGFDASGCFAGQPQSISAGGHTCTVQDNSTVWCWGRNDDGQLGDGTNDESNTPVLVSGLTDVTKISAALSHTCAVENSVLDGTVWCWGYNENGRLGDGTWDSKNTPVQVSGLTDVIEVSAQGRHTCALKSDGTAWCWGYNGHGQLGDGNWDTSAHTPVQVANLTDIVVISAGANHTCALKSDGTAWCWGFNEDGRLGDGTYDSKNTPVQVSGLTDVIGISAGSNYTCVLKSDGTAWCWGSNEDGQLGDGTYDSKNTPVQVSGLSDAIGISAGSRHTCVLKSDGTAWCWGLNEDGRLGDGTYDSQNTPVKVGGLSDVIGISAGSRHTCVLKSDGTSLCWGFNEDGRLGDGTYDSKNTPVQTVWP